MAEAAADRRPGQRIGDGSRISKRRRIKGGGGSATAEMAEMAAAAADR